MSHSHRPRFLGIDRRASFQPHTPWWCLQVQMSPNNRAMGSPQAPIVISDDDEQYPPPSKSSSAKRKGSRRKQSSATPAKHRPKLEAASPGSTSHTFLSSVQATAPSPRRSQPSITQFFGTPAHQQSRQSSISSPFKTPRPFAPNPRGSDNVDDVMAPVPAPFKHRSPSPALCPDPPEVEHTLASTTPTAERDVVQCPERSFFGAGNTHAVKHLPGERTPLSTAMDVALRFKAVRSTASTPSSVPRSHHGSLARPCGLDDAEPMTLPSKRTLSIAQCQPALMPFTQSEETYDSSVENMSPMASAGRQAVMGERTSVWRRSPASDVEENSRMAPAMHPEPDGPLRFRAHGQSVARNVVPAPLGHQRWLLGTQPAFVPGPKPSDVHRPQLVDVPQDDRSHRHTASRGLRRPRTSQSPTDRGLGLRASRTSQTPHPHRRPAIHTDLQPPAQPSLFLKTSCENCSRTFPAPTSTASHQPPLRTLCSVCFHKHTAMAHKTTGKRKRSQIE